MNLVVLTGAGISAESGVPTFRASDGLWEGHRIEEVATPEGFHTNPALVQQFYNLRRRALADVQPNAAHMALAELAARWQNDFMLVTQNVDDLHDRAHVQIKPSYDFELIHMHGELLKARCTASGTVIDWHDDLEPRQASPYHEMGWMRPHIVWFGEMPLQMGHIQQAIAKCDLFLSIGTSGNVYPAAGFVEMARDVGARTVEINLEPTQGRNLFDEGIYGPATKVLPEFLARL